MGVDNIEEGGMIQGITTIQSDFTWRRRVEEAEKNVCRTGTYKVVSKYSYLYGVCPAALNGLSKVLIIEKQKEAGLYSGDMLDETDWEGVEVG